MRFFKKNRVRLLSFLLFISVILRFVGIPIYAADAEKKYIRWIDFNVTRAALEDALRYDVEHYEKEDHLDFVTLISYLAYTRGGDFSGYRRGDLSRWIASLPQNSDGSPMLPSPKKPSNWEVYSST